MKLKVGALFGVLSLLALSIPGSAQPIQYQSADGINNTPVSATNPLPVTGSSGGGPATIVDGGDVTQGAKADSVCSTATGTCSIVALIKFLNNAATSAIVAGTNRIGYVSDDPCAQGTKLTAHFSSTSSGGNLITGTTAKITYICFLRINTSAAAHVSLCEATSTACSGGTPAAVYGNTGTTAANGTAYAANGGEAPGNGGYTIAKTATTGQNVDVLFDTTNSPQVNVDVSYVQQ